MTRKEENEKHQQQVANLTVPRVLHFAPGFRYGGVESLLMAIYEKIDKTQLQFDFMIDSAEPNPMVARIQFLGGRVFQMGRFMESPLLWHRKMKKIYHDHGAEYVALHSHDILRALPVLWGAKAQNISCRILHAHTDSYQGSRKALLAPFITRLTCPLATEFWGCSAAAVEASFGGRSARIFRNVIDAEKFEFDPMVRKRIRDELGIGSKDVVVGHTGRFTYLKNHKKIIEIFSAFRAKVEAAQLILVGEGPLWGEAQSFAKSLGVAGSVHFLGKKDVIAPYLSAMDLFLVPSIAEGFCISLLEAQANGLPCLVSNVVPPEVVVTPDLYMLDIEKDSTEWSEKLKQLLDKGRSKSSVNIESIKQVGLTSDFETSEVLSWYGQG